MDPLIPRATGLGEPRFETLPSAQALLYEAAMTKPPSPSASSPVPGDRIAKVLARAGVASRREVEKMIEEGRVAVNGKLIESPALNVTDKDRITVDGQPVDKPEAARMWLYHKPVGLVTTTKDEQGRETIFDKLPEDLPRVMTVGRLDLNSEGLLLLTNDGGIKRKLELPSTGWLRRYRVRVNGRPTDDMFAPLRAGLVVEGQAFQPMEVILDRQQGANAWLTVGLREGKNREIRRAMTDIGLSVNRLIRVSYGPFQLGDLKSGEVVELRPKVVRDQLGLEGAKTERPEPQRRRKPNQAPGPKSGSRSGFKSDPKAGASSVPKSGPKPGGRPSPASSSAPAGRTFGAKVSGGRTFGAKVPSDAPASPSRPGSARTGKPKAGGKPWNGGPDRGAFSSGGGAGRSGSGSSSGPKSGPKAGAKAGPQSSPKPGSKSGQRSGSGGQPSGRSGPNTRGNKPGVAPRGGRDGGGGKRGR